MANEEHLAVLRSGVEKWNVWRAENVAIPPLDLSGPDLSYANLRSAKLLGANLRVANLGGADLRDANLNDADLWGANLGGADLSSANLSGADLSKVDLGGANLSAANLSAADLSDANLSDADLSDANLSDADLSDANLSDANLSDANLSDADLSYANLRSANLNRADFSRAGMFRTILCSVDLRRPHGLEAVVHYGPSHIGIDTVVRSNGEIPEVFLRGAGVPDNFIAYMRSLAGRAIEFYSCFISYSTEDRQFAERIYADLQERGVRCWYAPEDLKIGDKIRSGIDEAIRVHQKLLLVLSSASIRSAWVEKEVETAFERERRENTIVLFPIRVDDEVMKTDQSWAADIRRTRNIGDFTKWKEHDAYTKVFNRLLRDLKPNEKSSSS